MKSFIEMNIIKDQFNTIYRGSTNVVLKYIEIHLELKQPHFHERLLSVQN